MRNEINQAYHSWFEFVQNKNNKESKLSIQFINKMIIEFLHLMHEIVAICHL